MEVYRVTQKGTTRKGVPFSRTHLVMKKHAALAYLHQTHITIAYRSESVTTTTVRVATIVDDMWRDVT